MIYYNCWSVDVKLEVPENLAPSMPSANFKSITNLQPFVVIPCGGAKRSERCPAGEMYVGGYHRACRKYANRLTMPARILILSAKHGLLRLTDVIEPYELRMGQPGSITTAVAWQQARKMGLLDESRVVALGGRAYTAVCRTIWPHCTTPLDGRGGIGKQLSWLNRQCQAL